MLKECLKDKGRLAAILAALAYWLFSFFTDKKIFSAAALDMSVYPIDEAAAPLMHILTKVLLLLFLIGFFLFLRHALRRKTLWIPFLILLAVYGISLVLSYPGYYMNDDSILFAYATRYYPVYWHCYLTSLFYMVGISFFPASCGPVLLSDLIYAMVYTYLFDRGNTILQQKKRGTKAAAFILAAAFMPFVLLGALMCFRPAVYSGFFVFYFGYLYLEWRQQAKLNPLKLCFLAVLTGLLAFWRSESIVLLPLGFLLFGLTYFQKQFFTKKCLASCALFLFASFLAMSLFSLVQKQGEKKYYGKDYLIISTVRPLSVILHRPQEYEGAFEDVQNINAVIDVGYILSDTLSCSAYNRYNSDHNEGRFTQTLAGKEAQSAYLKSALRLILKNPDLYLGERLQLFLVTNGIFDYDPKLVGGLAMTFNGGYPLYERDRDYSFGMLEQYRRFPFQAKEGWALGLFRFGGEGYLPMLALTFLLLLYSLVRRRWFLFFSFGALLAREAVIFLTAPASFIQYSYPMMYVTALYTLFLLADIFTKSVEK